MRTARKKKLLKKYSKERQKKGKRKCQSCKKHFYEDQLIFGPDPFQYEVFDEKKSIWLCKNCLFESQRDI